MISCRAPDFGILAGVPCEKTFPGVRSLNLESLLRGPLPELGLKMPFSLYHGRLSRVNRKVNVMLSYIRVGARVAFPEMGIWSGRQGPLTLPSLEL